MISNVHRTFFFFLYNVLLHNVSATPIVWCLVTIRMSDRVRNGIRDDLVTSICVCSAEIV